jgi:hypothetical protein
MPNSPTTTQETTQMETMCDLIDDLIDGPSCEMQSYQNFANASNPTLSLQILGLSLPHQRARKRKGKESLIDYIKSHVVTFNEHLNILRHKAMEKDVAKKIKKQKKKERGGEKS